MDDLRDLLSILKSHKVDYLIIGAHALAFHGHPRATKDVDVWVRRDHENAKRLASALQEFGAEISLSLRPLQKSITTAAVTLISHQPEPGTRDQPYAMTNRGIRRTRGVCSGQEARENVR